MQRQAAITLALLAGAACSVAPPVRVEERADRFLDDVRDTIGISALLAERGGLTFQGTRTSFDVSGEPRVERPVSLSLRPSGSFLLTVGDDGRSLTRGYDGADAWTSDPSDVVRIHALGSRAQILADGWLRTFLWLASGTDRFQVRALEADSDEATRVFELRRGNEPLVATVRIDRAEFLPRSVTLARVGIERTVLFSDWRLEGGVRFPHMMEEYAGETLLHRDAFKRRTRGTPRTFGAPRSRPDDTEFAQETPTSVSTRMDANGRYYVRVRIATNARTDDGIWMLVDTGFGSHALHTEVADALEAPLRGDASMRGVGGGGLSAWRSAQALEVGPLLQSGPQFVQVDTTFLTRSAGFAVGGVLGSPLFERAIVVLDDRTGRVEIHDPREFQSRSVAWEPVVMDDSAPCVAGRVVADGKTTPLLWFRLDTGSDDTVTIARWASLKFGLEGDRSLLASTQIVGVFGGVLGWRKRVERVELGGLQLIRPEVTLVRESTDGPLSDPWIAGNIGTRALQERRLTLDLGRSRLAIDPSGAR